MRAMDKMGSQADWVLIFLRVVAVEHRLGTNLAAMVVQAAVLDRKEHYAMGALVFQD
jgi:hypothetical protein